MAPTEPTTYWKVDLHDRLISETKAILELNTSFAKIAAGIHVEAEKDEIRSKLGFIISGLERIRERI